jgi:hypothetical protein
MLACDEFCFALTATGLTLLLIALARRFVAGLLRDFLACLTVTSEDLEWSCSDYASKAEVVSSPEKYESGIVRGTD